MRRLLLIILVLFSFSAVVVGKTVEFIGSREEIIKDTPIASTGLSAVYVVRDIKNITEMVIETIDNPSDFKIQIYSNLGGGYAQDISVEYINNKAIIRDPKGDMGYIVTDGGKQFCFWVVDYAKWRYNVRGIDSAEEQDCDFTRFVVDGVGEPIKYYGINGRQYILNREIELSYTNLEWSSESKAYISVEKIASFESLSSVLTITPPLYCSTAVILTGDRFLKKWGEEETVESGTIMPNGIAVESEAVQNNISEDESSNMIKGDETMLGGSAPADFTFYAYTTDAVMHNEWQIAEDPDFEYIKYRFNEQDLNYTFTEEGKYYVRFIGSNGDGSCEEIGDTYEIGIGASDLRVPNAFSPDGDGVNDVWKVAYRSLIEFKCWIFDRNGNQLFYFDRPELGWDGKYKGKVVKPGVYFYVIEAMGADKKRYKRGGDINILRYRKIGNPTGGAAE